MQQQVVDSVSIHVFDVAAVSWHCCVLADTKADRSHIDGRHVEDRASEDYHWDHPIRSRVDRILVRTWLDFDSEIKSIASFFFEEGLNPEDQSLILSPNTLECFYFTLALNSLGVSNIFSTEYEAFKNNIETISKLKPKLIILLKYQKKEYYLILNLQPQNSHH